MNCTSYSQVIDAPPERRFERNHTCRKCESCTGEQVSVVNDSIAPRSSGVGSTTGSLEGLDGSVKYRSDLRFGSTVSENHPRTRAFGSRGLLGFHRHIRSLETSALSSFPGSAGTLIPVHHSDSILRESAIATTAPSAEASKFVREKLTRITSVPNVTALNLRQLFMQAFPGAVAAFLTLRGSPNSTPSFPRSPLPGLGSLSPFPSHRFRVPESTQPSLELDVRKPVARPSHRLAAEPIAQFWS